MRNESEKRQVRSVSRPGKEVGSPAGTKAVANAGATAVAKVDLSGYSAAFETLPLGVLEAEVNGVFEQELLLEVGDGAIVDSKNSLRTRLYVRASGEKTGIVLTEKLDQDPHEVIERAFRNSAYSNASGPELMNGGQASVWISSEAGSAGVPEMLAFGTAMERIASVHKSIKAVDRCTVRRFGYATRTVNSKGLDSYADNSFYGVTLRLSLKRDGESVTGAVTQTCRDLSALDAEALVTAAVASGDMKDGAGALQSCNLASGMYRAVLSNEVVCSILGVAWLEFSGESMLNGTSIFRPEPRLLVGSELLNITNAPGHPLVGYYLPVDHEGSACEETAIVKNGKLVTPLYTLESGAKGGSAAGTGTAFPSTGSAGRVAQMTGITPISITTVPAVLYIEPGDRSLEELIAEMSDGLFLTSSFDTFHAINLASGDFSIPCGGVYYQGGEAVGTVSQIIMAGNLRDLFANIRALGKDMIFEEFYFKNYCYGGPSMLVKDLAFST